MTALRRWLSAQGAAGRDACPPGAGGAAPGVNREHPAQAQPPKPLPRLGAISPDLHRLIDSEVIGLNS